MSRVRNHPLLQTVYPRLIALCAIPALLALIALPFSLSWAVGWLIVDLLLIQTVALTLYGSHRIKGARESLMDYRQIEARLQLHDLIKPRLPLPGTREAASAPDLLLLLSQIMIQHRPQQIVECGAGVSTLVLGYLAQQQGRGHVTTLEHDPTWAARVTRWVADHGLQEVVTVVLAPIVQQAGPDGPVAWYSPAEVDQAVIQGPPIDLLFVDGPPLVPGGSGRYPVLARLGPVVAADGWIVLDDARRPGEIRLARDWAARFGRHLEWIDNDHGAAVLSAPTV